MGIVRQTPQNGHLYELSTEESIVVATTPIRGRKVRSRKREWLWDCLECNVERNGFRTMTDAEQDCLEYHDPASES